MTTRDQACVKLAQDLRDLAARYKDDPDGIFDQELFCVLGVGPGSSDDFAYPADVCRLAYIIDRPTCSNEGSELFICSKCGECVTVERKIPGSLNVAEPYIPDYCPCCGAKVVADDD